MGGINSVQEVWERDNIRAEHDYWALICHREKESRHPSKEGISRAHKMLRPGSTGWLMPRKKSWLEKEHEVRQWGTLAKGGLG